MRALAVLSVIISHVSYGIFYGGFLGVDLFFVLSGYLITGLLINEYVATNSIRMDLFYLRRFCRLIPALVMALILAFLIGRILFKNDAASQLGWVGVMVILFGLANFFQKAIGLLGVTWSLAVEEQFYWLWPVTLRGLLSVHRGKLLLPVLVGFILFATALRAYLKWEGADPQFLYTFTLTRIDSLFMGALAVVMSIGCGTQAVTSQLSRFRFPEAILIVWAVLLYEINSCSTFLSYGGSTLIAFFFAIFLLCIVFQEKKTFLVMLLESPPARWLGKRSYGIYLYHAPVVAALELVRIKHSMSNLVFISALRFAIPIVIAAVSYRYIELPFLRRKSRLHGQQNPPTKSAS
jgi:peptidoglycan/LPS O-acetylase OafA/YrhL